MHNTHCHRCGGFIGNPEGTHFRAPDAETPLAIPHSALCVCDHPVVFGVSEPAARVHRLRSASRN